MDLVNVGEDVEAEKDALLEAFFLFARGVCGKLSAQAGLNSLPLFGCTTP